MKDRFIILFHHNFTKFQDIDKYYDGLLLSFCSLYSIPQFIDFLYPLTPFISFIFASVLRNVCPLLYISLPRNCYPV